MGVVYWCLESDDNDIIISGLIPQVVPLWSHSGAPLCSLCLSSSTTSMSLLQGVLRPRENLERRDSSGQITKTVASDNEDSDDDLINVVRSVRCVVPSIRCC